MANEFGTLRSTYQMACFFLCVSMMYPHPKTKVRRIVGTLIMNIIMAPIVTVVLIDCYNSLLKQDLLNLIYHSTVIGPYLGGLTKIIASLYKSEEGYELISEIDRDYEVYNNLPDAYRNIARKGIEETIKYCQNCWSFIVMVSVLCYPLVSSLLNIGSQLFAENPRKYMVHDVVIPIIEPEDRFNSPIFEIVYVLMTYASGLIMIYYLGYDSFFGITVNHACLKINMYCKKFEDALKCKTIGERRRKLVNVVQEQMKLFEYVEKIESYFSVYLGIILFAALIQIGTCLYHINESEEMEFQYMMIGFGSICCIFFPCAYATNLKFVAEESATKFYCAGWENVHCISTRRTIIFMIARAQIPLLIRAFNWIVFDMDLFISIIKSAYSIYALLCS